MLIDTNIIITAAKDPTSADAELLKRNENELSTSGINYLEVLGYPQLSSNEKSIFEGFFASIKVLPIDQQIIDRAILIRRKERLKTADAIVAATALLHDKPLVSRDSDLSKVQGLESIDPSSVENR